MQLLLDILERLGNQTLTGEHQALVKRAILAVPLCFCDRIIIW
jgi:hypothetical protein